MTDEKVEYRVGDEIAAFHPRMFGVIKRGTIVKLGSVYAHVDFGSLAGGIIKVVYRDITWGGKVL